MDANVFFFAVIKDRNAGTFNAHYFDLPYLIAFFVDLVIDKDYCFTALA